MATGSSPRRFILLASGRTGSNFLADLLNSHPRARCFGEIFNPSSVDRIRWKCVGYETTSELLQLRDDDPVALLERVVFSNHPSEAQACGFKLFYYHAQKPPWDAVWPFLREDRSLEVIHLRRRNELRKHVSEEVARATGRWHIANDADAHRDISLELDIERCLRAIDVFREQEQRALAALGPHETLDLYYEDLIQDTVARMGEVLRFLGLDERPLRAGTKKQIRQPLSDLISNYGEVRDALAHTRWSRFLED
jgi:LPS sulfotransferase NodH